MKTYSKYYGGIFLVSFGSLLYELSLTRVFSVTLWYHFGFLIISTALLGFGASGVLLSGWKKLREVANLDHSLARLSVLLSVSILFSFWLLQKIPFDPFSLYKDRMQFVYMPITYILVALPFFFTGLILSLLFTRFNENINRLYAFDLAGAALGCIAVVLSMKWFGGGGSVIISVVFTLSGALIFAGKTHRWYSAIILLTLVITIFLSFNADKYIPLRITDNKGKYLKLKTPLHTEWNTFSRIDLYIDSSEIAKDKLAPVFIFDQGTAATGLDFDLRPDVKDALRKFDGDSLYPSCVAYLAKSKPDVLVIGSGCGTQVLDALHHGAGKITAVEINPIINRIVAEDMNEMWGNLFHQCKKRPVITPSFAEIQK